MLRLEDIKPYENNAKIHNDEQIKLLAKIVKEVGWRQPVLVNQDGVIIAGHGRLLTYTKFKDEFKLKEIWIIDDAGNTVSGEAETTPMTKEQEKMFRIADNQVNLMTGIDIEIANIDLKDLSEPMVDLTGLNREIILESDERDDVIPQIPKKVVSAVGDLYQLGKHRILCGDSTTVDSVERLMDGKRADVGFNDPPYGMKKENVGVLNDNLNFDELLNFNYEWITLQFMNLKENGSFYCWGIDEPLMDIYSNIIKPYIQKQKATFRNLLTWDKASGQGQNSEIHRMYATADEKCLFIMLGKQIINQTKDDFPEEWRDLLNYFLEQKEKSGLSTKDICKIVGVTTASHWFTESQFTIPTKQQYEKLQEATNFKCFDKPYESSDKESGVFNDFYNNRAYFNNTHDNMNNVWHFDRTSAQERELVGNHATPKPLALCERAIKTSCPPDGIVVDFFLGSGSTLIASEKVGVSCYAIELDPKYVDVAIERYCEFTGNREIFKNGQPITWNKEE